MRKVRTCPEPISADVTRRGFLKRSLAGAAGVVAVSSLEEQALQAAADRPPTVQPAAAGELPCGRIGKLRISRLICGGNLISGYAHARDLIYMSRFLKEYFTDERVMDTWQTCEEHGINTMIINPNDTHAIEVFQRYHRERGGKMQWLAQIAPLDISLKDAIRQAVDHGAVGVFLVGNLGDRWCMDRKVDRVGQFVELGRREGVVAGVAGHSLEMLEAVTAARIPNDFFMKTLHHHRYWSAPRETPQRPVIANYAIDNYYDVAPERTIAFMARVRKPWIAYKVLAAGAIHPRDGFDYAFRNGADFACVGMFDFQVAEDVQLARAILSRHAQRARPWRA